MKEQAQRESQLPKVTQWVNGRLRIRTQEVWLRTLKLPPLLQCFYCMQTTVYKPNPAFPSFCVIFTFKWLGKISVFHFIWELYGIQISVSIKYCFIGMQPCHWDWRQIHLLSGSLWEKCARYFAFGSSSPTWPYLHITWRARGRTLRTAAVHYSASREQVTGLACECCVLVLSANSGTQKVLRKCILNESLSPCGLQR